MEKVVAVLFKVSLTYLSIFIFINFVLAILGDRFLYEKEEHQKKQVVRNGDLSSLGAEICKAFHVHHKRRRSRSGQVIPNQADLKDAIREHHSSSRRPSPPFFTSLVPREILPPPSSSVTQELELTFPQVIYINENADGVDASEKDSIEDEDTIQCAIPMKSLDEAAFGMKKLQEDEIDLSAALRRLEDRIRSGIQINSQARQWAIQARLDLLRVKRRQPASVNMSTSSQ